MAVAPGFKKLDVELSKFDAKKEKKRPSSITVNSNSSTKTKNDQSGPIHWKGKFDMQIVSSYTKNDIVQFQSGLYILKKNSTKEDPNVESSGWVEYLKAVSDEKKLKQRKL